MTGVSGMKIGFVGVAHSHAFSDAANVLHREPSALLDVWHPVPTPRLDNFASQFSAEVFPGIEDWLGAEPDLLVVTLSPADLQTVLPSILLARVPTFINKVVAATMKDVQALREIVSAGDGDEADAAEGLQAPVFTTSVLRYAPKLLRLRKEVQSSGERIESVHVEVIHSIADFLTGERAWQDDPAQGGGTAISMGVHVFEIFHALTGQALTPARVQAQVAQRTAVTTASEDSAAFQATDENGILYGATVLGRELAESYEITVRTETQTFRAQLAGTEPMLDLGYRNTLDRAFELARGKMPVDVPSLAESLEIYAPLIEAVTHARET